MIRNLSGQKFGRLFAQSDSGRRTPERGVIYKCLCDCGNICFVPAKVLRSGESKSCGCLHKEISRKLAEKMGHANLTHGHAQPGKYTREYRTWYNMRRRCYYTKQPGYLRYGARGIFVCRRWRNSFENFFKDMGNRPEGKTIDRVNNDGPYGPWNCKWSTAKEQANNRKGRV